MSKPMLVTLPFVLLLLDYWPLQRVQPGNLRRLLLEKWPFWLLTVGSCLVTYLAQRHEAVASLQKTPLVIRFENLPVAYAGYLWKLLWPTNLAVFYPLPKHIAWEWWTLSVVILAVLSIIVWAGRKQRPYCLMGWLWFLGTLVPVIGLVQVGDQAMADRYTYFPSIGIFIAITFAIRESLSGSRVLRPAWVTVAVLVLSACTALTENQLRYWKDSESLFSHALVVTGDNALAHLNLGAALQAEKKPELALAEYKQVLQLDPLRYEAWSDIAKLLSDEMNRPEEALPYCRQAIQLNPSRATLHNSLGLVLAKLNRLDEAMAEFATSAKLDATYSSPHFQIGQILLRQGKDSQALDSFNTALRLDPENYAMLIYLARLLASDEDAQIRNGAEALVLAGRANHLTVQPDAVGLDTLAMACAETGSFDLAVQIQQQALQLARADGEKEDAVVLQKRLQSYQNHLPWRESYVGNQ
jgi:tetratricopeptide (TPR) repeat protein